MTTRLGVCQTPRGILELVETEAGPRWISEDEMLAKLANANIRPADMPESAGNVAAWMLDQAQREYGGETRCYARPAVGFVSGR